MLVTCKHAVWEGPHDVWLLIEQAERLRLDMRPAETGQLV